MDADEIVRSAPPASPRPRLRAHAWEVAKTLTLVLILVFILRSWVVEAYVIHGRSMESSFHESDRILVEKLASRFETIARGDVIVFNHPGDPSKRLIKRVIGLPGETVEMLDGVVYISGKPLDESTWLAGTRDGSFYRPRIVEADHYFVLGDNRAISNDSRRPEVDTIPRDAIVGKYLFKFYPFDSSSPN